MITAARCLLALVLICNENIVKTSAYRIFKIDGQDTILASENENIIIQCKSDFPITYCDFVHPNGKRFSFIDRTVVDGTCVQKIKATKADSGEWSCHIGKKSVRLEDTKKIQVRLVNEVAAIVPNVTTNLGKPVTLACATTKGFLPLSYCRFEPPTGQSFNIDSSVTAQVPILQKYYYPSNASIDRGDCAVTISKVKYEDVGNWICGAGFDDGKEHIDVIRLDVEGAYTMSTASTTGVIFGSVLIVVALIVLGYTAWKKRRLLRGASAEPENIKIQDMGKQPRSGTPRQSRNVPVVVVQSPSDPGEPGSSPLISRLHSPY